MNDVVHHREAVFKKAVIGLTALAIFVGGPLMITPFTKLKGKGLNSRAWRASFSERRLPVPVGPREGWWGIHLSPRHDSELGMVLPERHVPEFFNIDALGMQTVLAGEAPRTHLVIIGGSVAAGAYASNLGRTYFSQLAHRLNARAGPVKVTVMATGAWTSASELQALRLRVLPLHPDYVMFLDGLNDLTLNKQKPENERVEEYLRRMREARDLASAEHFKLIFAPQPFLPGKRSKTGFEVLILAESYPRVDRLVQAYDQLKEGLRAMEVPGKVFFVESAGAFDDETRTTFADIWHFSDVGHALLAERLAGELTPMIAPLRKGHDRFFRGRS